MSTLIRTNVLFLLIILLPPVTSAAGDTASYRVDSYIPVLFRDLQWTFTGGLDLTGGGSHGYQPPSSFDYDTHDNGRSHQIQARSDLTRTLITRALTLTTGFTTQMELGGQTSGSTLGQRNALGEYHDLDSSVVNQYHYSLALFGTYTPYIVHDLFVSLYGSVGTDIVRTYDDDEWRETSSMDSTDLTEVYWSHLSTRSQGNESQENYNYTITLSAGWGHIYYGNYAATALYMINELKDHGQLTSDPAYSVMDSLTEMIYQFRMAHAIDSRLRRIEALNAIGTFLRSHGVTDMADPIVQLYLEDIWIYFPSDSRPFGFQVKIGGGLRDNRLWTGSGSEYTNYESQITRPYNAEYPADTVSYQSHRRGWSNFHRRSDEPYLTASLDWYRPISLRTQLSANLAGSYYLDPYSFTQQNSQTRYHTYNLSLSGTLDYILNSRTRAQANANLTYATNESVTFYPYSSDPVVRTRTDKFHYGLAGTLQYRISIPTSLQVAVSYSGNRNNYRTSQYTSLPRSTDHSYSLTASVVQYIY